MASNEAVNGLTNFKSRRLFRSNKRVRTYIMPTGFGYTFGAISLVLFFLAVGYANNLIFIFLFLLISMALTGMIITNRNTDGIEVFQIQPQEMFAKESGVVLVSVKNIRKNVKLWQYELFFQKSKEKIVGDVIEEFAEDFVEVPFTSDERGEVQLPRLILQSTFPVGLFRAWKSHRNTPKAIVYPSRKGTKLFPVGAAASEALNNAGLFREHRSFQSSDPLRRIDWRASARRQELLVKTYEEGDKPSLRFRWEQTGHINDFEDRLSQMSLWIDEAERGGHEYSLEVGSFKTSFARGPTQFRYCMEYLAKIKKSDGI